MQNLVPGPQHSWSAGLLTMYLSQPSDGLHLLEGADTGIPQKPVLSPTTRWPMKELMQMIPITILIAVCFRIVFITMLICVLFPVTCCSSNCVVGGPGA